MKRLLMILLMMCIGTTLLAKPQVGPSVSLAWDAVQDSLLSGYNVYRSNTSGMYGSTPINTGLITTTTYTDTTVMRGQTYFYVVTAIASDKLESDKSNEVMVSLPKGKTNTPQNLRVVVVLP